jgi:hypothetical protein
MLVLAAMVGALLVLALLANVSNRLTRNDENHRDY